MEQSSSNRAGAGVAERDRTLLEINNAIITKLTQAELFDAICQALERAIPFDRVALVIHEPENDALRIAALAGPHRSNLFVVGHALEINSHSRWVFDHQVPLLRHDLEIEQQPGTEKLYYEEGIRSICTLPLIAGSRSIGAIGLGSKTRGIYSETDVPFLQQVATQVALAISNMKAYEAIAALNTQVAHSEQRWRAVYENSAVGVALTDLHGHFLAANRAYQKMLGYTEEELRSRTFLELTYEDDREANWSSVADLLAGKRTQFQMEKRYRRKDGSFIWVRNYASIVPSLANAPGFLMTISEDIGERKQAQEALQKSEERSRTLLEINNAIITSLTEGTLLSSISKALHRVVPFDASALMLYVPESDTFRLLAVEGIVRHFHVGQELSHKNTSMGWVFDRKHFLLRHDLDAEQQYTNERLLVEEGMRSHCVVPLIVRGDCIGTLNLASRTNNQYSEGDAAFLQEVATQIALAIQNMKAYEEIAGLNLTISHSAQQTRTLLEINNAIITKLTQDELVHAICEALKRAVPFDEVGLILYEQETNVLRVAAVEGFIPSEYFTVGYAVDRAGPAWWVFENQRVLLRKDLEKEIQSPIEERAFKEGIRSLCELPLIVRDRPIGVLSVSSVNRNQYSDKDAAFLREVSNQVAIAIANMKSHEEVAALHAKVTRAAERARTLLGINNAVISSLTQESLLQSVSGVVRRIVPFDRCAFTLYQPARETFRYLSVESNIGSDYFRAGLEFSAKDSVAGTAFQTRGAMIRHDLEKEHQYSNDRRLLADGIRSDCVVPMLARGNAIGTLNVGSKAAGQYSDQDAEFLQEVATQVALAVENMQAYEEINTLKTRVEAENVYLQEEILRQHNFDEIVGNSPALLDVLRRVEIVAPTETTVLLYGETGTGKELLARAIHTRSPRRDRAMVTVNCGAIPAGLVESELFGHVKGAFTGALQNAIGRFELADGSTLFLDEVGELPADTQVKLLRVLQEHEFQPVGSSRTKRVDVRIIAATNRNLEEDVQMGRFRSDLFYRLNVVPLQVPALRERRSDIPELVLFFLQRSSQKLGKKIDSVSQDTLKHLVAYQWPGNIRELQNVIERGVVLSRGSVLSLGRDLLPVFDVRQNPAADNPPREGLVVRETTPDQAAQHSLAEVEREHILRVLDTTGWVIDGPKGAARVLKLHHSTLRARMKKLQIKRPRH